MSLANLKKPAHSVNHRNPNITAERFIDEALSYANGYQRFDNVVTLDNRTPSQPTEMLPSPLRRATFTLGDKAIEQLNQLSLQTGLSKSALLRQLIDRHALNQD